MDFLEYQNQVSQVCSLLGNFMIKEVLIALKKYNTLVLFLILYFSLTYIIILIQFQLSDGTGNNEKHNSTTLKEK